MGVLLGYAQEGGMYQRQKGRNPVPTIKVGHTHRVYEDDVLEALHASKKKAHTELILSLYQGVKKNEQSIRIA